MQAILSVTTNDGTVMFHTRKGLVPYAQRDKATKFKTIEHAVKFARRKYRLSLSGNIRGWNASTQMYTEGVV